ncbi:MAG: diaminopimelate dehydrogenase [Clostridia bacterium]|nr:diaminopimelate dehydrogenase [Clostridia bacterium]
MSVKAIVGYGRLGRSLEQIMLDNNQQVIVLSTRKDCNSISPCYPLDNLAQIYADVEYAYLCVGSATQSSTIAPYVLQYVDTIDCYDNHAQMNSYMHTMSSVANSHNTKCMIGFGWDPGLLSLYRLLGNLYAPAHTFWGEGVSMGHTNAVKQIEGVADCVCYTIPYPQSIADAMQGNCVYAPNTTHKRIVDILPSLDADRLAIVDSILSMKDYFVGYEVDINFLSKEQFNKCRGVNYHKGQVICTTSTYYLSFTVSMQDNSQFTAQCMYNFSRALPKLNSGSAYTITTVPPYLYLPDSNNYTQYI